MKKVKGEFSYFDESSAVMFISGDSESCGMITYLNDMAT